MNKSKQTLTEHRTYSSRQGQTLQADRRLREKEQKKHGPAQPSNHADPQTSNLQKITPAEDQISLCSNDARPGDGQKRHVSGTNAQRRGRAPHFHTRRRSLGPQEDLIDLAVRHSEELCRAAEAISTDAAVSGEDVVQEVITQALARQELASIAKAQLRVQVTNKAIDARRRKETRQKTEHRFGAADAFPLPDVTHERRERQRVAAELITQLCRRDLSHAQSIMRGESAAEYGRGRNQSRWAASAERREVLKRLRGMLAHDSRSAR